MKDIQSVYASIKVDIHHKKEDIESKKVDIRNKMHAFSERISKKTIDHALVIFSKYGKEEYFGRTMVEVIDNPKLSVVCNVNIGHATPRCIIPFGVDAVVDVEKQRISFSDDM